MANFQTAQEKEQERKYWEEKDKRTKEYEKYKQSIIGRTAALNNALDILKLTGVESFTFENILLTAKRLYEYIETGETKIEKLDQFIESKKPKLEEK